jgi:predicted dehydrogenase
VSGRIKAAVLSAGAWSRTSHLPTLSRHPDVDLVALSSPNEKTAASLGIEFGVPFATTDWRDALALHPEIVVVSSPPVAHEKQVVAALEMGAHVLVEKPFALDRTSAYRMHEAAERLRRTLLVGFGWPASPIFALSRALIEADEIGHIEHLTMHLAVNTRRLLLGGTDGGWGGQAQSAPTTYTDRRVSGGGCVAVSMSHQLGLIEWLIGEPIVTVNARIFPSGAEIDLHASVTVSFAGGGSGAISSASTHPYLARPQWTMALYGSRGQLWLDSIVDRLRVVRADGHLVEYGPPEASGVYDPGAPTDALVKCALGAQAPAGLTSRLAARVVAVTDAIYESARSGRTVGVQPL